MNRSISLKTNVNNFNGSNRSILENFQVNIQIYILSLCILEYQYYCNKIGQLSPSNKYKLYEISTSINSITGETVQNHNKMN